MAATLAAGVGLSAPVVSMKAAELIPKRQHQSHGVLPAWRTSSRRLSSAVKPVRSSVPTPPGISEMVKESIKHAEETCAGDSVSGECAAAWDEVEELSAAASHAREKLKANSDPLENYCKDNPETDECRTYED